MHFAKIFPAKTRSLSLTLAAAALALLAHSASAAEPRRVLGASASPASLLRSAHLLGRLNPAATLHAEFVLPPRNQAALESLLRRQYTPGDPLYRHFLTPDEFTARFGPTPQDYAAVAAYARAQGLTVTGTTPGRTLLSVSGPNAKIEAAFGVQMGRYRLPSGRVAFSSSAAPTLPRSIAARLSGVVGLSNLAVMHPQLRHRPNANFIRPQAPAPITGSGGIGSGPLGGLSPNDIKYAYGLDTITTLYGQTGTVTTGTGTTGTTGTPLDGTGQNIGLFELDGFIAGDIAQYVGQFALPTLLTGAAAPVTTVLIGNYSGVPLTVDGKTEVTLDIDLILALAPNSTGVYVYEADPSQTSPLDVFTAMATNLNPDGSKKPLLQIISCSWGINEAEVPLGLLNAENAVFQQMAAQGQSVFCAAGDSGAYDAFATITDGTTITTTGLTAPAVDNPASQPYVTGVGGTKLAFVKPGVDAVTNLVIPGSYTSEKVWSSGDPAFNPEGGGGGISSIWSKPSYQTSGSSPNRRDVPDVTLNSDPNTGYSIFVGSTDATAAGTAEVVGGTSAAAPLWAAYTALVNQRRTANGLGPVGFLNPVIYPLLTSTAYTTLFHDIVDGDNLFYQAGPGYDDASGLGSFVGAPLLTALSFNANQGTGTATINGTVTDTAAPPAPIAGATVSASTVGASGASTTVATTTTDAGGVYTLSVPSGLALRLTVTVPAPVAPATAIFTGTTITLTALAADSIVTQPFALDPAHLYTGGVVEMISAPYDYSGLDDFAAVFGLSAAQASTTTRLVKYVPGSGSYVFYPTAPADTFRLGQGYWTRLPAAGGYLHLPGTPASTTQPFSLPLQAGWNQIGDPFPLAAPLSGITVSASGTTAAPLASAPTVVQAKLYGYNPAANAYTLLDPAGTLDPYAGYWIYAFQPCTLAIPVPAGTVAPPTAPGV